MVRVTKLFGTWFAMGDGKLSIMRTIREDYTDAKSAFLPACYTVERDASGPEVVHLAVGMRFAGFNGMNGALWQVDDKVVHSVVPRSYRDMFKHQNIGCEHAAAVLNDTAVVNTASKVSLEKRTTLGFKPFD